MKPNILKRAALACAVMAAFASPTPAAAATATVVCDPATELAATSTSLDTGRVTTTKDVTAGSDSTFDIQLSAIASAASVTGYTTQPQDIVFVIDVSGSMQQDLEGEPRYERMVEALNTTIASLMEDDPDNRVGIVAFASSADGGSKVLLPLGRYEACASGADEGKYVTTGVSASESWGGVTFQGDPFIQVCAKGARPYASSVTGGTNLEKGLGLARTMFLDADASYGDVERTASIVIISDGDPTYVLKNTSWWEPTTNGQTGAGTGAYAGNGFISMLTAASVKQQVDAHYGSNGTTRVYTIGCNVNELDENDALLADAVLDPSVEASNAANPYAQAIADYWNTLTTTGSVSVNVGSQTAWGTLQDKYLTITKAPDDPDYLMPTSLEYVDSFYNVTNVADLNAAFSDISSKITSSPATNALSTGTSLVFEDWTDAYTGIDGVSTDASSGPVLTIAGTGYAPSAVSVSGSTYTYSYTGTVDSTVVPGKKVSLAGVSVVVTKNDGATPDHLVWTLPADLVPHDVYYGIVTDGSTCTSLGCTETEPATLSYGVSVRTEALTALDTPWQTDDAALASFVKTNMNADGTISFYANEFETGASEGSAYATFTPASTNAYYIAQDDLPIYTDESMSTRATSIDTSGTYYTPAVCLEKGSTLSVRAVATSGSALSAAQVSADGMYEPAGTVFNTGAATDKTRNETATAASQNTPTISGNRVVQYLGNNGKATYALTGAVAVTKSVTAEKGLSPASDAKFPIAMHIDGYDEATWGYALLDAAGSTIEQGSVSDGSYVDLQAGQTLYFYGLPAEASYLVTEGAAAGFSTDAIASGTVRAGKTATAALENTYSVTKTTIQGPTVQKTYTYPDGVTAAPILTSTFTMTGEAGAPMPENADTAGDYPVSTVDISGSGEASFGSVTVDAPGTWTYTITEADTGAGDVSFSAATYTWTLTATDDGAGSLDVSTSLVKQTDDAGADAGDEAVEVAAFANGYEPDKTSVVLGAYKRVDDASGAWTLADGQFEFVLEDAATGEVVSKAYNQGGYVVMPAISYDSPGTYVYTLSEVDADVSGMTCDAGAVTFTVRVADDDGSLVADVSWSKDGAAGADGRVPMFENVYAPASAEFTVTGEKKMEGRALAEGETCAFTLEAADAVTRAAVKTGEISVDATATASGNGTDEAGFTFMGTAAHVGTYTFYLRETAGDAARVTYDAHAATVTVTVRDAGGALAADVAEDGATFTNVYTPESVAVALPAITKTLTGRDSLAGESFGFTARYAGGADATGAAPSATVFTATAGDLVNGVAETATFPGKAVFTEAGVYTYRITETAGDAAGVDYDDAIWTWTVTVVDDTASGALRVSSTSLAKDGTTVDADACAFENTYAAQPLVFEGLVAEKEIVGRDFSENDAFGATIAAVGATDAEGNEIACPMPEKDTVTMTGAAPDASFGAVTYAQPGTYVYRIDEVAGEAGKGFAYDCPGYLATVTVTADTASATLNASVAYETPSTMTLASGEVDTTAQSLSAALFMNVYTASGTIPEEQLPEAVKVVEGLVQKGGECSFALAPADDASAAKLGLTELVNAAAEATGENATSVAPLVGKDDGTSVADMFAALVFDQDDCGRTFAWTLSETDADAGFSTDATVWRIEVTPTDNGDGTVDVICRVSPAPLGDDEFAEFADTGWSAGAQTIGFRDTYVAPATDAGTGADSGAAGSNESGASSDASSSNDTTANGAAQDAAGGSEAGTTSSVLPVSGDSNSTWLTGLIACGAVALIGAGVALARKKR